MPEDGASFSNPFPGLRPFEPDEDKFFFGRDGQSDELLRLLQRNRFVAVVGTSGSGKSSLVRAGMLVALRSGFMTGAGSSWRIAIMRPGADPIGNLVEVLSDPAVLGTGELDPETHRRMIETTLRRSSVGLVESAREAWLAAHENLLVVVDQFEEIFRLKAARAKDASIEDEASAFVKLLLEAAAQTEIPVYITITMRSDFLGDCSEFRDLPEALNRAQYLIPRMTRDQRREAIEGPVAVGGATIAPRLVQRLLNDVGDDPDQLPVLQHALMRTWEAWEKAGQPSRPIDFEDYDKIGTMTKALSNHANEALGELDARGKWLAMRLFQCLTEKGIDNRETRRPSRLDEICAVLEATQDQVVAVIDRFRTGGRTFLVPAAPEKLGPDSVIDITHESLIRLWEPLRKWTDEEAESAASYRRLQIDAELEKARHGSLWRGPELALALKWKQDRKPNAAWANRYAPGFAVAMDFLERSSRARQISIWIRRGLVAALVLITIGAGIFAYDRNLAAKRELAESRRQQLLGMAGTLAQQAGQIDRLSKALLDVGALLAIQSSRIDEQLNSPYPLEDDVVLHHAAALLPKTLWHAKFGNSVNRVVFSPDGRYVAAVSNDGTARIFDTNNGNPASPSIVIGKPVFGVAFSPNSNWIATASADDTVRVIEATSGKEVWRFADTDELLSVAFSPDGKYLAAGCASEAHLFDAATGKVLWHQPDDGYVVAVAFSPDGRYVATASSDADLSGQPRTGDARAARANYSARLYEVATGNRKWTVQHDSGVNAVAFSPDGRYVASGSSDNTAHLIEVSTGASRKITDGDKIFSVAFSPCDSKGVCGRYLATGSNDGVARVFDTANGDKQISQLAHSDDVRAVAFSPSGRYLATASLDGTARVFEILTGTEVTQVTQDARVLSVAFNPNGGLLATGSSDGGVRVFMRSSGTELSPIELDGEILAASFSTDGLYAVTGGADNTARLFEVATGKEVGPPLQLGSWVDTVAFRFDGKRFVAGSYDNTAVVADAKTGRPVFTVREPDKVFAAALSRDGQYMADGGADNVVRVYDLSSGVPRLQSKMKLSDDVLTLFFGPKNDLLGSGCADNTAQVWNPMTGQKLSEPLQHDGNVYSLGFSPCDSKGVCGQYLATGSLDGYARVFQRGLDGKWNPKPISKLLHGGRVSTVYFSTDGKWVATGSDDHTARVFEAATGKEIKNLTFAGPLKRVRFTTVTDQNGATRPALLTASLGSRGNSELIVSKSILRTDDLIDDVCHRLTRNLTRDEWRQYLSTEPYQKTCPNLP